MSGSTNNTSSGASAGANVGNTIKGAWQTVAGAGDAIRGNAMDFVDTLTGTGGRHTETDAGAQQTNAGLARVKGATSGDAASGAVGEETVGAQPTATAAPPLPERRNVHTAAAPTGNTGRLNDTSASTSSAGSSI